MRKLLVLRGLITIVAVSAYFVATELFMRLVTAPLIRLQPASREQRLTALMNRLTPIALWILRRVGGAKIEDLPQIPNQPGTLVLVNHQSLLDIPLTFAMVGPSYPKFVTRRRYASGFPVISYMLRLYEHPLVEPGRQMRGQLEMLGNLAATSEKSIVIFPEGSRARDGEIKRFRRPGLKALLTRRPMEVYIVVVDGLWRCARFTDFVRNVSSIEPRAECLGPFAFSGSEGEIDAFIDEMFQRMCDKLKEMRNVETRTATG